jgi:trehalose 6-phosphate synthase/phosphatase
MADPEFAGWLANELVATLDALLAGTDLRAARGDKTVEVKPAWANKGDAGARFVAMRPDTDFVMALGDDLTDEDLFAALPPKAWTLHVGDDPTRARFRLPDPESARRLLDLMARASVTT